MDCFTVHGDSFATSEPGNIQSLKVPVHSKSSLLGLLKRCVYTFDSGMWNPKFKADMDFAKWKRASFWVGGV